MTKATNILSRLAAPDTNVLHDIKAPVFIPDPWLWVWVGAGLLVMAAVGFGLWRFLERRRVLAAPPALPPAHERARLRLQEALALIGQPREFCIAVSDTVRWYLEERFDFRAPERTTEEFLHELQGTELLKAEQKNSLEEFLQRCDLVKFAKYEPREPELRELHDAAVRLVEETKPKPVSEATSPPQVQ